ncbi:hypothetical protein B0H11DRAFT_1909821 [Mycena galericulata]|nr:hypothetical protein B0H11DRAFT_1909821 [Mycena galericulata]
MYALAAPCFTVYCDPVFDRDRCELAVELSSLRPPPKAKVLLLFSTFSEKENLHPETEEPFHSPLLKTPSNRVDVLTDKDKKLTKQGLLKSTLSSPCPVDDKLEAPALRGCTSSVDNPLEAMLTGWCDGAVGYQSTASSRGSRIREWPSQAEKPSPPGDKASCRRPVGTLAVWWPYVWLPPDGTRLETARIEAQYKRMQTPGL